MVMIMMKVLLSLLVLLRNAEGFAPNSRVASSGAVSSHSTTTALNSWFSGNKQKEPQPGKQQQKQQEVCTVQILMSDTGGGHRASANALRDAFDVLYPGRIQCDIVDIYTDYGPFPPFNSYVEGYKIMAKYPILWSIFYHVGATPLGLALNEWTLETFCFEPFLKCLARHSGETNKRADMVISVHPLTQGIALKILAFLDSGKKDLAGRQTPFCTVVTDLGSAHPAWFDSGVDKCYVPSDALVEAAKDRKLRDDQIVKYGLPIRKGFWATNDGNTKQPTQQALKKQLGLDQSLPTVLIVGGGDGMGGLVDISKVLGKALGRSDTKSQMVVVCGKNEQAKQQLQSNDWGDGISVNIQGFVNNMDEWMRASDALVTKAGPGTIAEASICGLPCMMFSFLPGQEAGNIPFVEESGFGKYSGDPTVIAETVTSWLTDPALLREMRQNALKAARPEATLDIARDLAQIVFDRKAQTSASSAVEAKVRVR